jgi:BRCA1 C Terminus (BRCT) domain
MRTYEIKQFVPSWHFAPATVRQLKVLLFFGMPIEPPPTKGMASGLIGRLFSDAANKHLWAAYVYTTGDEESPSMELCPHDREALANVVIPEDWHPKRGPTTTSADQKVLEDLISGLLKEGSPFDDPLPETAIHGKSFCFTGAFDYGSRSECRQAVVSRGGSFTEGVTSKTDVLVIGSDASPAWSHGNFGNKIEAAMVRRMQRGKPVIIPEAYWRELLQQHPAASPGVGRTDAPPPLLQRGNPVCPPRRPDPVAGSTARGDAG